MIIFSLACWTMINCYLGDVSRPYANMASTKDEKGLPTEVAFELSGHQGAVRAVRFNSKYP